MKCLNNKNAVIAAGTEIKKLFFWGLTDNGDYFIIFGKQFRRTCNNNNPIKSNQIMKIIKSIGIALAGIIILLFIAALLIPNSYTVSTSILINKPQQEVFDYVKVLKNQEAYSVWLMADKGMPIVYAGVDGTVGASMTWNSKDDNVGAGSQTITTILGNERIDVDLKFIRPMSDNATASTMLKTTADKQTEVRSEFYGESKFPMNLMNFIGQRFIKEAEVQNLENLKKILEK